MPQKQQEKKYCSTEVFSKKFKVKADTVRRSLCLNGHYLNVVPLKLPTGRLLWPDIPVEEILLFEPEAKGETFIVTSQANSNGFLRGDLLVCQRVDKCLPGMMVVLERDDCGRWPMPLDEAEPELATGARLIGQVLSMSRNLDTGVPR